MVDPERKKVGEDRITEYISKEAVPETTPRTEIAKRPEFYKIPRRFGSVPVDELPLGCDPDKQFYKIYPRVSLPFEKADRISFGHPHLEPNKLFWGDNLHVMRMLPSHSIDLIYIDPPFFSGKNYNVIFGDQNEVRSFTDVWEGGMPGYLIWMNARLLEMKRLLKQTGSIYVHLGRHASHYVKVELDKIFGYDNFRGEIIWYYQVGGKSKNHWARKHDTIFYYSKSDKWTFNGDAVKDTAFRKTGHGSFGGRIGKDIDGRLYQDKLAKGGKIYRYYLDEGKIPEDVWEIQSIQSQSKERIGYPTQKPEALLERIIKACSNHGDVVADFFCGGGTTPCVAQKLGRRWLACDQSRVAVAITQGRIQSMYEQNEIIQERLTPIPDISLEYWGTYEIPSLVSLSDEEFKNFIVSAYGGRISSMEGYIHGYKGETPLCVGPASQEKQITKEDVVNFAKEISTTKGKREGIMLAWAFAQSAKIAVQKLVAEGNSEVDLIIISPVEIESSKFREHITKLHSGYESFLRFILPPQIRFSYKRISMNKYSFDVSESVALNAGAKIINVQWDFDFKGRFTPSKGFAFGRDEKGRPLYKVEFIFDGTGKRSIACRVQDDLGGEKIYPEYIRIQ